LALLREAQRRHPGDFWINSDLSFIQRTPAPDPNDDVRYATAALAARPQSPDALIQLGWLLQYTGFFDEAVARCRQAIRLRPDYWQAHNHRRSCLSSARESAKPGLKKGLLDAEEAAHRDAIRCIPTAWASYANLAWVLLEKGSVDEALAECRNLI